MGSFVLAFVTTPFLGKEIATNSDFRKRFVPEWYDFSIVKPISEWTRAGFHERFVAEQQELHERAIRGDFSPEKLEGLKQEEMKQQYFQGSDPMSDAHGWGKLHPGLEDDEDEME